MPLKHNTRRMSKPKRKTVKRRGGFPTLQSLWPFNTTSPEVKSNVSGDSSTNVINEDPPVSNPESIIPPNGGKKRFNKSRKCRKCKK